MTSAEHNRRYRDAKTAWQRARREKEAGEPLYVISEAAVASVLGISRSRVAQIERAAIRKLWQGSKG